LNPLYQILKNRLSIPFLMGLIKEEDLAICAGIFGADSLTAGIRTT
jgi:hypothetical protein